MVCASIASTLLTPLRHSPLTRTSLTFLNRRSHRHTPRHPGVSSSSFSSPAVATASVGPGPFSWDDVLRIPRIEDDDDPSDLRGYFRRVRSCNRGMELRSEFVPFVVEDQVLGYIHRSFIDNLVQFVDVFTFSPKDNGGYGDGCVSLHQSLGTPEDRTKAVEHVIRSLGGVVPGIRNELYPVTPSFGVPAYLALERAAAPYFGIKAYGVHVNGYVEKKGQKFLWIGKRSNEKQTYPGLLDHLVAGGMPHGISCKKNVIKECEEEAGIPRFISNGAVPVGAVSYIDVDGHRYKRDVLFCYDLKLPEEFLPKNQDGEVDSFRLIPVTQVANIIRRTEYFKPNCSLVIIDFLFRHGYMNPDNFGYLELLQGLRTGDSS